MVWSDLAKYLTKRFGLGEIPTASRRLYARLEREAEKYGDPVRAIISDCADASVTARGDRGVCFRAFVAKRLRDHGYLLAAHQELAKDQVAQIRSKVLAAIGKEKGVRNE